MAEKVILAYSGGLDTSAAIKWLADKYKMGGYCSHYRHRWCRGSSRPFNKRR